MEFTWFARNPYIPSVSLSKRTRNTSTAMNRPPSLQYIEAKPPSNNAGIKALTAQNDIANRLSTRLPPK